ncbi:hypothetical protein LOTGIDRAFT_159962 [Lottia gigantea]|uniref:PBZ-type domain-containing protein n=1 Tax=Lottia gigantea TaxID=225164 RepID=V4AS51_LOTGI|nr:hypothetical protein LOTGIDRAFT_159962 [Lottia gigantea]ESO96546.1 hypothetical protein LOTGIDRAFT_159962 [Lottia gigantea]
MASVQLRSLDDGNITDVPESGVTVVGRGPFLEITDKRVSRNHANLEIVDGKLYLTPIHVNPCFFKKGGEGSQKILEKDEKFCLEEGDVFGLLPDQLFFKVLYKNKPVNGDVKKEPESVPSQTNGDTKSDAKADPDESWDKSSDNEKEEKKPDIKNEMKSENNNDEASSSSGAGPSTVTPPGQKEMALPLERKRQLPAWLVQAAKTGPSPEKKKTAPKVPAASKRAPRAATSKPIPEAFLTDGEDDDEIIPVKKSRGRPAPRKPPKDSFSEGESEEEPPPKPKNRSKTLTPGTRTPRRKDQFNSDEDDSDELIGRKAKPIPRRTARPPTPESFTPSKRPVRAAKYARGSYVDDYIIEDEESDDYDEFGSQKKYEEDSDFIMEDDDSGSDWGSKKSKGKGKGKAAAKNTPKPRSTAKGSRSRGRSRKSRSDVDSDEYLDEYVPRPSKRRASKAAKSESEEDSSPPPKPRETKKKKKPDSEDDDDGDDEPKKRIPCEFGKKCYRKNPAHFKECCHPGDKSYDEADDDEADDDEKAECPYGTSCFRTNPAHQEQYSHNNKPKKDASRPKRETAGKKSVLQGDEDDNGERNTYDYNDSFLDNNEAEESEESFFDPAEEDSDYDPESEDVAGLLKEAKGFQKNKKLVKPARSR